MYRFLFEFNQNNSQYLSRNKTLVESTRRKFNYCKGLSFHFSRIIDVDISSSTARGMLCKGKHFQDIFYKDEPSRRKCKSGIERILGGTGYTELLTHVLQEHPEDHESKSFGGSFIVILI